MRVLIAACLVLVVPAGRLAAQGRDPDSARIVTDDVPRFWNAWDRMQVATTREDSLRRCFRSPSRKAARTFSPS